MNEVTRSDVVIVPQAAVPGDVIEAEHSCAWCGQSYVSDYHVAPPIVCSIGCKSSYDRQADANHNLEATKAS